MIYGVRRRRRFVFCFVVGGSALFPLRSRSTAVCVPNQFSISIFDSRRGAGGFLLVFSILFPLFILVSLLIWLNRLFALCFIPFNMFHLIWISVCALRWSFKLQPHTDCFTCAQTAHVLFVIQLQYGTWLYFFVLSDWEHVFEERFRDVFAFASTFQRLVIWWKKKTNVENRCEKTRTWEPYQTRKTKTPKTT